MRKLTDADIEAIISAMKLHQDHNTLCRFADLDPEILAEAVQFYRNINLMMSESGKVIWKTVLVSGVGGLIFVIGLGIAAKIKQIIGQ